MGLDIDNGSARDIVVRVRKDKGMDERKIGCEHKWANAVMKWKYKTMKERGREGQT